MKKMQLLSFHQHHVRHGGPDAPPRISAWWRRRFNCWKSWTMEISCDFLSALTYWTWWTMMTMDDYGGWTLSWWFRGTFSTWRFTEDPEQKTRCFKGCSVLPSYDGQNWVCWGVEPRDRWSFDDHVRPAGVIWGVFLEPVVQPATVNLCTWHSAVFCLSLGGRCSVNLLMFTTLPRPPWCNSPRGATWMAPASSWSRWLSCRGMRHWNPRDGHETILLKRSIHKAL